MGVASLTNDLSGNSMAMKLPVFENKTCRRQWESPNGFEFTVVVFYSAYYEKTEYVIEIMRVEIADGEVPEADKDVTLQVSDECCQEWVDLLEEEIRSRHEA